MIKQSPVEPESPEVFTGAALAEFWLHLTSVQKVEVDGVRSFTEPQVMRYSTDTQSGLELIPRLANDCRVIAPDLRGVGFTEVPAERKYLYTLDALASTIEAFTEALQLGRYASMYSTLVGQQASAWQWLNPDRVTAIVSQNGNAYEERLGHTWGRSGNIGLSRQRRIERSSGKIF